MKTILVIEDNSEIRENVTEILELAQYKVISAENGKDGVALAMQITPDLVLCDIMMPVLDGYGVLHLFNKDPKLSSVPFIFVSAKASRDDFRKGMDLGADDYITKPYRMRELVARMRAVLRRSAADQGVKVSDLDDNALEIGAIALRFNICGAIQIKERKVVT